RVNAVIGDLGMIGPDMIAPVCGSKEGLVQAALLCLMHKEPHLNSAERPVIAIINPGYHVYYGAALAANAELLFLDCDESNDFCPHPDAISPDIWPRIAGIFLCSPNNPCGTMISQSLMQSWLMHARTHDALLIMDECYSEIYFDEVPTSALVAARNLSQYRADMFENLVIFQSLSKRSAVPGIRNGFACGSAALIHSFRLLRGYIGAQLPGPLMRAACALWQDEDHVENMRLRYCNNVNNAREFLGFLPGFRMPDAGFFLWLKTGDDIAMCQRLWRDYGLKTLPGSMMARPNPLTGKIAGVGYIRFSLVHDENTVIDAFLRLSHAIDPAQSPQPFEDQIG
ncbi:MAG: aminotransferase class I/II-fold pyridoxal phosphate-dependent enzyme, partial [Pseudomonadota bacterium]